MYFHGGDQNYLLEVFLHVHIIRSFRDDWRLNRQTANSIFPCFASPIDFFHPVRYMIAYLSRAPIKARACSYQRVSSIIKKISKVIRIKLYIIDFQRCHQKKSTRWSKSPPKIENCAQCRRLQRHPHHRHVESLRVVTCKGSPETTLFYTILDFPCGSQSRVPLEHVNIGTYFARLPRVTWLPQEKVAFCALWISYAVSLV